MNTLDFEKYRHCIIFVCTDRPIDDREWQRYLDFLAANLEVGVPTRSLVLTTSASSLTSTQRKSLARTIEPFAKTLKSAVVADSALVRGIVTALAWFSRDVFKIFAPNDLDKALEFLELGTRDAAHVELIARRLLRDLESRASAA